MKSNPAQSRERDFWSLRSRSALVRILAFIVLAFALGYGSAAMLAWLRVPDLMSVFATSPDVLLRVMLQLLPFVLAYWLLARVVEGR